MSFGAAPLQEPLLRGLLVKRRLDVGRMRDRQGEEEEEEEEEEEQEEDFRNSCEQDVGCS